jgi:hypothetical protein
MAGRIRSIKPEILEDEKTAGLDHLAWRVFVSAWLIADDYGNFRGDPAYVRGQILWATSETQETVGVALEALARVSLLSRYRVRGQSYYHITGWGKHQKVDKPGKRRMPGPDESDPELKQPLLLDSGDSREDSRESRESLAPDLRPPTSDQDQERELARAILPIPVPSPAPRPAPSWGLQSPAEVAAARLIGDLALATWKRVSDARMDRARALKLEGLIPLPAIHPGKQPKAFDELRERIREEGDAAAAVCDHVVKALVEQGDIEWLSEKAFLEGSWRTARAAVLKSKRKPPERAQERPAPTVASPDERSAWLAADLAVPADQRRRVDGGDS